MSTLRIPVSSSDHSQGPADAPVTLVEYGDYQCPYCGEAYDVIKQLQARFGNKLRFVFRNFPIVEAHPQAAAAAITAEYAGSHGKFWQAHDALYENQGQLGEAFYAELMRSLGLDVAGLQRAFDSGEFNERIQADIDGGLRSGVNGTPGLFINGQAFYVRQSFSELAEPIEEILGQG